MTAELRDEEVLIGAVTIVDGLPGPACNLVYLSRVGGDCALGLAIGACPVAAQSGEWFHIVSTNGLAYRFRAAFCVVEVALPNLPAEVGFTLTLLIVQLVICVSVEDDSVEKLGVVDAILIQVLEEGVLELIVRIDVLAE